MTLNLPMPIFRLTDKTPLVSRSAILRGTEVIVMDGAQFEDDRRRIVVGREISDETMTALETALFEHERIDGMCRWIADLLAAPPAPAATGERA
jgi:hypothetical protein